MADSLNKKISELPIADITQETIGSGALFLCILDENGQKVLKQIYKEDLEKVFGSIVIKVHYDNQQGKWLAPDISVPSLYNRLQQSFAHVVLYCEDEGVYYQLSEISNANQRAVFTGFDSYRNAVSWVIYGPMFVSRNTLYAPPN